MTVFHDVSFQYHLTLSLRGLCHALARGPYWTRDVVLRLLARSAVESPRLVTEIAGTCSARVQVASTSAQQRLFSLSLSSQFTVLSCDVPNTNSYDSYQLCTHAA